MHVRDQTEKIISEAIKQNPEALACIENQTFDMCVRFIDDAVDVKTRDALVSVIKDLNSVIKDADLRLAIICYIDNKRFMKTKNANNCE